MIDAQDVRPYRPRAITAILEGVTIDAAGLRVLTRAECLRRLRTVTIGRVAISSRALPMILPVHFHVADDDSIRIATRRGTTLDRATHHAVVAFEAEGPSGTAEPSWSVIVNGLATQPEPIDRFADHDDVDIAISVEEVSGREVLDLSLPMAPVDTSALARW